MPIVSLSLLDRVMDATVVPGYSRIGYAVRHRAWRTELPRMDGKVVLVTGATSGLGRAAAEGFARLGARVLALARNQERGERAVREILAATGAPAGRVELVLGDLSDLASLRTAAADVSRRVDALHVLVHNAGALVAQRTESVDGVELTFATNVLGPFALTEGLLGVLESGRPSRIVTVSSGGMYAQPLRIDDLQFRDGQYRGAVAYARTKRAEVLLTEEWGRRLAARGITAHAMHPGWVDTPGIEASLPGFSKVLGPVLRSPQEGADTIVWLGAAPEPGRTTGRFWHDRVVRPVDRLKRTRSAPGDPARLYAELERLTAA